MSDWVRSTTAFVSRCFNVWEAAELVGTGIVSELHLHVLR